MVFVLVNLISLLLIEVHLIFLVQLELWIFFTLLLKWQVVALVDKWLKSGKVILFSLFFFHLTLTRNYASVGLLYQILRAILRRCRCRVIVALCNSLGVSLALALPSKVVVEKHFWGSLGVENVMSIL